MSIVGEAAAGEAIGHGGYKRADAVYFQVEEHTCGDGYDAAAGINVVEPLEVGGGVGEFYFVVVAGDPASPHFYDVGEVEVVDGALVVGELLGEAV